MYELKIKTVAQQKSDWLKKNKLRTIAQAANDLGLDFQRVRYVIVELKVIKLFKSKHFRKGLIDDKAFKKLKTYFQED